MHVDGDAIGFKEPPELPNTFSSFITVRSLSHSRTTPPLLGHNKFGTWGQGTSYAESNVETANYIHTVR
jgi:hypothetical protein